MIFSRISICVTCLLIAASAVGNSYGNAPSLKFPEIAKRECISGDIVVEFRVVGGHAVDMTILSSEPNSLYTNAFLEWWSEYNEWSKGIGMLWGDDTGEGELATQTFRYDPCAT
jgi:hypothetical protein